MVGEVYDINDDLCLGSLVFELDTGSDRVILTRKICVQLGLEIKNFSLPRTIRGVSGRSISCSDYVLLRLELIAICGSKVNLNLLAYVYDNNDMPCLIGNDVFAACKTKICYDNRMVELKDRYIGLFSDFLAAESKAREVNGTRFVVNEPDMC